MELGKNPNVVYLQCRRSIKYLLSNNNNAASSTKYGLLGGILALRATNFSLRSPVKNPHTNTFQTPSKLGHPCYTSSRHLRTTFPSHQML